jgi:hypothetical protein
MSIFVPTFLEIFVSLGFVEVQGVGSREGAGWFSASRLWGRSGLGGDRLIVIGKFHQFIWGAIQRTT